MTQPRTINVTAQRSKVTKTTEASQHPWQNPKRRMKMNGRAMRTGSFSFVVSPRWRHNHQYVVDNNYRMPLSQLNNAPVGPQFQTGLISFYKNNYIFTIVTIVKCTSELLYSVFKKKNCSYHKKFFSIEDCRKLHGLYATPNRRNRVTTVGGVRIL